MNVKCQVTVAGCTRPDGKLWDVTNHVVVHSPMLFPDDSGAYSLGVQAVTYSQDAENGTTTTLDLVLPDLLTMTPNPNALPTSGGQANPTPNPDPTAAQADAPDTTPAGDLLGHA